MINLNTGIQAIKTETEINTLVDQYYAFVNQPLYVMAGKDTGSRFDEEETDQILRLLMILHIFREHSIATIVNEDLERYNCFWIDRSDKTLYSKFLALKKKYIKELAITDILKISRFFMIENDITIIVNKNFPKDFGHERVLFYFERIADPNLPMTWSLFLPIECI